MKHDRDMEQLIDRAIARDRDALPAQPKAPDTGLLAKLGSTPAANLSTLPAASHGIAISSALKIGIIAATIGTAGVIWRLTSKDTTTTNVAPPAQTSAGVLQDTTKKPVKRDSASAKTTAGDANVKKNEQPVPSAYVPSENDLPAAKHDLDTLKRDTRSMHVDVK